MHELAISFTWWPTGARARGVGLAIGILTGLSLARFIEDLLYGVSSYDPITLALTVLVLGTASLFACLLPAVKALQIDPVRVLNE